MCNSPPLLKERNIGLGGNFVTPALQRSETSLAQTAPPENFLYAHHTGLTTRFEAKMVHQFLDWLADP